MSKVYDIDGRRKCDACWKNYATTKRKCHGKWFQLCAACADTIDKMRDKQEEKSVQD